MSEELLINISPMESRVAVISNGVVSEVFIERAAKLGLVGNIYLGTVVRVLPGMQAAFIDIGQPRTAFLHVNDMQKLTSNKPKTSGGYEPQWLDETEIKSRVAQQGEKGHGSDSVVNEETDYHECSSPISTDSNHQSTSSLLTSTHSETKLPTLLTSIDVPNAKQMTANISLNTKITRQALQTNESCEMATQNAHTSEQNSLSSPSFVGNGITRDYSQYKPLSKHDIETPRHELIQYRLQEGQKILVQVTKDQLGTKGARLTTNISLPSRYLVYLPSSEHIGISQRIEYMEERERLKSELEGLMQAANLNGGLIARTASEYVSADKLEEDIYYLVQLWRTIQARKEEALSQTPPAILIYQELSLPMRAIRDLVHADTERVVVDNEPVFSRLKQFSREFVPFIQSRLVLHQSEQPLFDIYRVEEDLKAALDRRVDLKSGGYLIIDQTEAMTTIDVNTGSFVGGRSLEDTVYKTNLEATHAIARQLRLRNLGGIIILDFIDMTEQEHKDDVLANLQMQLSQDYAKTKITQVSELGLVEMTRKRTRESLEQQLCEPCPTCEGRGVVKSAETVCFEIFREIMRCARTYNAPKKFTVVAHAAVIDLLLSAEADTVADLEYLVGRVITFEVESRYTQEQYDIVLD